MELDWKALVAEARERQERDARERVEAAERWLARLHAWRGQPGTPPPLFRRRADNRPAWPIERQIAAAEYELRDARRALRALVNPPPMRGPVQRPRAR